MTVPIVALTTAALTLLLFGTVRAEIRIGIATPLRGWK